MITTAVLVFLAFFLVLLLVLLAVSTYSDLVHRRGEVDDAWVWIEVRLKHRHDLVAELVEVVRGHGARDRQALEAVAAARSRAAGAQAPADRMAAEDLLSGALRSLFAATGAHPDLKAGRTLAELREKLAAAEDRITRSRRHYNDAVLIYNNAIQMSPADIVAGMGGFSQREYLRDQDEERRPVRAWF